MNSVYENQLDVIADALVTHGYFISDDFLPSQLVKELIAHMNDLSHADFKAAGIGRKDQFQIKRNIRSDKIRWIEPNTPVTADYLEWMEMLRVGINRRLFLGLFDFESHFAHYQAGAFYKKHIDEFNQGAVAGQSIRVLSTVVYLNDEWHEDHGGELVLYTDDGEQVLERVNPYAGRMVIFLSKRFPHEVLPAKYERKSIAGWFRVNQL